MVRLARVVVPGIPHHVTQRGNRRQDVFFGDEDYAAYVELLQRSSRKFDVAIWAWCLMPNHVHLILVPETADGLRAALAGTHRRYTLRINERENWQGYLWQGRFASFPMDEKHLLMAARYVELNPVRAGLVDAPEKWQWSSAAARLSGEPGIVAPASVLGDLVPDWRAFLNDGLSEDGRDTIRAHERTGRALGSTQFVQRLERATGRILQKQRPGPKAPEPADN